MILRVLGAGAGGGLPQWNCACTGCRQARENVVAPRTQDSLAVSADGARWYLVNATPDVRIQLARHADLWPGPGLREMPLEGILLTDGELDHTIGLLVLREGTPLTIYGTASVRSLLETSFPVLPMLVPYAPLSWRVVTPGEAFPLADGRLEVFPFRLPGRPPRYARQLPPAGDGGTGGDWEVGYRFLDRRTGGVGVYAPGVAAWTRELEEAARDARCVFLDGTFWSDDELVTLGGSEQTALEMGHVPVGGPEGSARLFSRLAAEHKVYVHINNTNPILRPGTAERKALDELGIQVAWDGLEVEV